MNRLLRTVLPLSGLLCVPSPSAPSQSVRGMPGAYQVTDLGVLPGGVESEATALNHQGTVIGTCTMERGALIGFVYAQGRMQFIEPLRRNASLPEEINDSGAIVGYYLTPFVRHTRAFIARRGTIHDPGTFGGKYCRATGINARGLVVGVSTDPTETLRPFLYRSGSLQRLSLPRSRTVYPTAINDRNEIAGYYDTRQSGPPLMHAFIYREGRVVDLGSLSEHSSRAADINNRGQAAGYYQLRQPERSRAFLYDNGRMTDIGDLGGDHSIANSLNDQGEVVGYSAISSGRERREFRAFLYRQGRMADLNTLIPRDSGWVLLSANDINNRGQIVGYGRRNGQKRAFLLTPLRSR